MSNYSYTVTRNRMLPPRRIAVCASLVAVMIAGMSGMQAQAAENRIGYLTTTDGAPVPDAEGTCVRTGEWVSGMYYRRCDAPMVKASQVQPATRPVPVSRSPVLAPSVPFKLSVDALFDFDRASLKPKGRALLDQFADRIRRASFTTIEIIGHSDRIGSPSYNERLSERRARAVRSYLATHGLAAGKLVAEGKGSSEPVTAAGLCRGLRGHRLIECLQPDRYAELKVSGTAADASARRALLGLESIQTAGLQPR